MAQYYVPGENIASGSFVMEGPEAFHAMKVMRKADGQELKIFDGRGRRFKALITETGRDFLRGKILAEIEVIKPRFKIALNFTPVSKNAIDDILDKCTQLGADSFRPVNTARCEHDIAARFEGKLEQWNKNILASCKQCERAALPQVREIADFKTAVDKTGGKGLIAVLSESAVTVTAAKAEFNADSEIAVLIGPEGGFSPEETEYALSKGLIAVTLGPNVLRAETACAAAVALLLQP